MSSAIATRKRSAAGNPRATATSQTTVDVNTQGNTSLDVPVDVPVNGRSPVDASCPGNAPVNAPAIKDLSGACFGLTAALDEVKHQMPDGVYKSLIEHVHSLYKKNPDSIDNQFYQVQAVYGTIEQDSDSESDECDCDEHRNRLRIVSKKLNFVSRLKDPDSGPPHIKSLVEKIRANWSTIQLSVPRYFVEMLFIDMEEPAMRGVSRLTLSAGQKRVRLQCSASDDVSISVKPIDLKKK